MPIEDGFGSVGDKTFYHRNGVCYLRRRVRSEFPGTIAQMQQLSVHLRALESWRQLPFDVQQRWNGYAVGVVSHRPPFDGKSGISGHNLFVSAYHGFATLGREHTPAPAPFAPFPSFLVKLLGASAMDDTLQIRWKLEALDPDNRYRMLCKVQLGLPGTGRSPGMLRNFLAEGTANDASATVSIPNYKLIWGLDLPSYQLYARCILLDTTTGYRSQYYTVSGVLDL